MTKVGEEQEEDFRESPTKYIEPEDRIILDELPPHGRSGPRIWMERFSSVVGTENWQSIMIGRKAHMHAIKSNFKAGKYQVPEGHRFEMAVVHFEDQPDNIATLFCRWLGYESEEEKNERIKQEVLAKLDQIEQAPVVDDEPEDLEGLQDLVEDEDTDEEPEPYPALDNEFSKPVIGVPGLEDL